jgi:hypothetical protein
MKRIFIEITVASEKEIWMQLMEDVYDSGLTAEFADFYLENPGMSIIEIDREFRNEWDI